MRNPIECGNPSSISLQDIPRLDDTTYKYLGFEMKNGEIDGKRMLRILEERIGIKSEEPTKRVDVFKVMNGVKFINQNMMSVIRFYSGPVKFTLGWLDRIDKMIRQRLTKVGTLMKRGMATSLLYTKPEDMGLKSCVAVYLSSSSESSSSTSGEPSSDRNGSGGCRSRRIRMERATG